MNLLLEGKTALVTGSTQGIGRAIATTLAAEGCSVAVTGRSLDKVNDTVQSIDLTIGKNSTRGFQCDFTSLADIDLLVKNLDQIWGQLDILVCNIGSGRSVPPLQEDQEEWQRMMDINFYTVTNALYGMIPLLSKCSTQASIACISSICGVEALGAPIAYSVAKGAIVSLVNNLSKPLGNRGIRINCISPGNVLFPGSVWENKINQDPHSVQAMLDKEVALQRCAKPEEIADAVAFLVSPRASFITGSNLVIDGGQVRSI